MGARRTDLVVLCLCKAIRGDGPPSTIRAHPELRVNCVLWDDLASHDMAHEQIIVHRLRDDLSDGRRHKLDEAVVFRPACLDAISVYRKGRRSAPSRRTLLFRERRRRDMSPNWEK